MAPSPAESWAMAKDGLSYEFVLRKGVVFHNGDPLTAEDVKFSFERYRGAAAKLLKEQVSAVEIADKQRRRRIATDVSIASGIIVSLLAVDQGILAERGDFSVFENVREEGIAV
jgi:ABC-type transport system substrate-binding protein